MQIINYTILVFDTNADTPIVGGSVEPNSLISDWQWAMAQLLQYVHQLGGELAHEAMRVPTTPGPFNFSWGDRHFQILEIRSPRIQ